MGEDVGGAPYGLKVGVVKRRSSPSLFGTVSLLPNSGHHENLACAEFACDGRMHAASHVTTYFKDLFNSPTSMCEIQSRTTTTAGCRLLAISELIRVRL